MLKKLSFAFLIFPFVSAAQSTYAPMDKDYYNLIDRYEIRNGAFVSDLHTSFKEYRRADIVAFLDTLSKDSASWSNTDKFNINYLYADNWNYKDISCATSKSTFLKHFYKTSPDFYSVNSKDFKLRVSPVLYWQGGKESDNPNSLYINTRGIQVEGMIDDKVGFYTIMADNQAIFPEYATLTDTGTHRVIQNGTLVSRRYDVPSVAGQSFIKTFKNGDGRDFFTARGYFNFGITKHIDVQFGHGRQFVGNGYRSLILSDFAPDYLFLKFNTNIWKIRYTNLFTEMMASSRLPNDPVLPKKYMAFHHLSINLLKNLNFGIFEAIVYAPRANKIELSYLNPIIFYRSVEQTVGSPDNALLGADLRYNFLKHFQIYSQVVLDEFRISSIRARDGWWANKQAVQVGAKYVDIANISNLDLQVEYNAIRPFMYTHDERNKTSEVPGQLYSNYAHYMQPLAHPMGANLKEKIFILRYQPINYVTLSLRYMSVNYGMDTLGTNWGSNILKDNSRRSGNVSGFGNFIGQGFNTTLNKMDFTLTVMPRYNVFLDLQYTLRKRSSQWAAYNYNSSIISASLRWNITQRRHDF